MHRSAGMPNVTRIIVVTAATAALGACSKPKNAVVDTTSPQPAVGSATSGGETSLDTMATIRGTIASVSATQLVVTTDSGSKTVALAQPVAVYDRSASTLASVKDNTFIGVTTVKQPDGSERATEIHIFPEALRGLGEGSRLMASGSQMTNGSASPPRMSNGNVASSTGSTMVVQYASGSQNVTIPSNTPVTEIRATSKPLAAGETVVVLATKRGDGTLSANRVLLAGK
jgi:Domain of unknown function (DUF5666)